MSKLETKSLAFLTTALISTSAFADIDEVTDAPDYEALHGASRSNVCGWPTAVSIGHPRGDCTATIIAPDVIVFAAHCSVIGGGPPTIVRLGENAGGPVSTMGVQRCGAHPSWDFNGTNPGHDIAWCTLQSPIDLPIIPMIDGCEVETLQRGKMVTMVGYGVNDGVAPYGTKLEVEVPFIQRSMPEISMGELNGGKTIDNADSGGPAFVQLENGEWRMFGVASFTYPNQPGISYHNPVWPFIGWLEEQTGKDLSPCFTNGEWDPNESCGSIPLNPGDGGSRWVDGCPSDVGPATSDSCEPEAPAEEGGVEEGADDSSGDPDPSTDSGDADSDSEDDDSSSGSDAGASSGEGSGSDDDGIGSDDAEEGGTAGGDETGTSETGASEDDDGGSSGGCAVADRSNERLPWAIAFGGVVLFWMRRRS